MYRTYYETMTNAELLEDATNESLLDYYRKECKAVLLSRLESEKEIIEL